MTGLQQLEIEAGLAQELARAVKGINRMPEIGGKSLAADLKVGLSGLKKKIEELRLDAAGALTELSDEIVNGQEGVKRIRAETAAVRDAFSEILGNESAASEDKSDKPQG